MLANSEVAYYQKDQDFDIPILFEPPTIVTPEEPGDDGTVTASAIKIYGDYQTISAGEWAMTILQFDTPHASCYVEVYNPYGSRIHREYIGSVQAFNNVSHIWYTSTSTPPGTYKIRYDVGNQWPTEFTVYVQAPQLNITLGPYPSGAISTTSATIYWATNYNSDSVVYYGTTPNLGSYRYGSGYTTSHSVGLTGLLPGTTYYYMVQSSANGQTVNSGINSFTTKSSLEVYTPTVSNITSNSATISWYSNMSATGNIQYSRYSNFSSPVTVTTTSGTYHYGTLSGLQSNTTYYYRVSSYADGVTKTLGPYTFTTGTSLNITSGPNHSNISSNSAAITWATNVNASSLVEYGTSSLNQTESLSGTRKTHSVYLSGLKPSTTYQYRVTSVANGVPVTSPIRNFTTQATIPSDKISERDDDTIDPNSTISDPVDAATGAQLISLPMLTVQGAMPIDFTLSYNSLLLNEGPLGKAWGHNFETRLEQEAGGNIRIHWKANKRNTFTPTGGNEYSSANSATRYDKLVKNVDNTFTLIRRDQSIYKFNSSGQCTQYGNGHGQVVNIQYDAKDRVSQVTEPISGKYITFTYNANDLLDRVSDNAGRQVSFTYNGTNLIGITDPNGKSFVYTHDGAGRIVTGTDGDNKLIFTNTFDAQGRVASQDDNISDNQLTTFTYDELSEPGKVITTVGERNGSTKVLTHDSNMQLVKLVDELGYIITYTYDADGNKISETNAKDQTTLYSYDDRGNLLTITDPAGHVTTMTYDEHNNLLSVQNAVGKSYVYTYDSNNNLLAEWDPLGKTRQYTYENDLLKTQTSPRGGTITYTYENGLVKTITSPEGTSITYGYDATGNITSITDGAGKTTIMQYDEAGNLLQVSDPLGNTQNFTYNSRGQILTETDANNNTTRYEYNGNGKLQKVINALNQASIFEYDAEDRLLRVTDGRNKSTTFNVDSKGRTTGVTDALGRSVNTEYDSLGNVTVQKDAYNRSIMSVSYDDLNNPVEVTDALGNTITRRYDNLNRLVEVIDALGRSTGYNYDDLNRLVSAVNALGGQSSQGYDEDGNINQISDANGNRTSYVYDLSDRVISQTTSAGKTLTYQYDNSRDLLSNSTNGRGQVTTYQYDAAGRLISYTDPDGTVSFTYDANGNVLTMSDNAGTVSYTYDVLNRLSSYTDVYGNTIGYTYDAESNLTALTYPGNKTVSYSYDAANQLISVTDWIGRKTGYSYDNNGLLITTARPDGSVETRTYDAAGRLTQIRDVKADGSVINQFGYTYDEAGNIISEDGAVISDEKLKLPSSIEQTFGADNRLSTFNGEPIVYDADGNMTTGPLQGEMVNYQYDSQNRLISVGDTSYTYDAANNRIAKNEDGTITRYVVNPNAALSQLLMETDENGTAQAYYIYGIGLVGKIDVNGNKYYSYHFDNRGNTVALTDETGEVTDRYSYEPYGEIIQKFGETENCFLYVGQYGVMAENNGLYYMRARYYNPEIKAFINEDTVIGNVADTLSLNRYAYVKGNPLIYVDPSGHTTKMSDALYGDSSGRITSGFGGYTIIPGIHEGIDFASGKGKPIYSLTEGEIFHIDDGISEDGIVKISTIHIYDSVNDVTIIYMHLIPFPELEIGKTIKVGDLLGYEDSRGAKGVHTHVEVRVGKRYKAAKSLGHEILDNPDPTNYWNSKGYIIK